MSAQYAMSHHVTAQHYQQTPKPTSKAMCFLQCFLGSEREMWNLHPSRAATKRTSFSPTGAVEATKNSQGASVTTWSDLVGGLSCEQEQIHLYIAMVFLGDFSSKYINQQINMSRSTGLQLGQARLEINCLLQPLVWKHPLLRALCSQLCRLMHD